MAKYSLLERFKTDDLYNSFLNLEEREQIFVIIGIAFLCLILLVLPVTCASSKISKLETKYNKDKKNQVGLMEKMNEYQHVKEELAVLKDEISKSKRGGSLVTIVESMANEAGLKDNMQKLTPLPIDTGDYFDEEGVEGVLSKVSLDQLVSFLYALESNSKSAVLVKKMEISTDYRKRDEIMARFQITSIVPKEGETGE
ncbi:type II secretion system protein M [bacterium]|nr:type II secretion system protein M [bacterium]